jgi:hypothetical protein
MNMNVRVEISIDDETRRRAEARAAEQGISFDDYVRQAISRLLGPVPPAKRNDITAVFDLVTDGPATDIARDKDKMVGEAAWHDYSRKTAQSNLPASRAKKR